MKNFLLIGLCIITSITCAQQKQDTVIVELANTSRVIFTIKDRKDLDILKHYDFNKLFADVLTKLEKKDSANTIVAGTDSTTTHRNPGDNEEVFWTRKNGDYDTDRGDNDNDGHWDVYAGSNRWGRTWQSFNFDFGTNNYLSDGKFPDTENAPYAVRPWGSWYVAASSIQRTRLGKKFFLEWGLGMSWYTFKFQDDNVIMQKDDDGTTFVRDDTYDSYEKSKLSASYVMATLIPVIDFGDNNRKPRVWEGYGNSFRIGLGPYIGYRVSSHSKVVYKNDGDKEKDKDHDSFYLNNFRYGARLQIGYRSTDLFFNYDINELFTEGKGPKLNAFSFGVIF
ncbi:MAG TPA: hypothetical protein VGK59_05190 [Ohtaekwangia sp.]